MRIAIASDHPGQDARERLAEKLTADGHEIVGASPRDRSNIAPSYANKWRFQFCGTDAERGIIVSSRGVGDVVAANGVPGVRAALCSDAYSAHMGAKRRAVNVLVLVFHNLDGQRGAGNCGGLPFTATLAPIEVVGGLPPRRLQRVSHIRENISRDLSVTELAQGLG